MWVAIYEDIVRRGELSGAAGYPVLVNGRYIMAPSPIPRWDIPKLNMADAPVPLRRRPREAPLRRAALHRVVPLEFEDYRFEVESFEGKRCARCGATDTFLDETVQTDGGKLYTCSDTAYCERPPAGPGGDTMAVAETTAAQRARPDEDVTAAAVRVPRPHRPGADTNSCPHCGSIVACADVDLDVYAGEVLGVVGETGSGKSTVLQCLFQDMMPTSGEAYLTHLRDGGRRHLGGRRRASGASCATSSWRSSTRTRATA